MPNIESLTTEDFLEECREASQDLAQLASSTREISVAFACHVHDYVERSNVMSELTDQAELWKILEEQKEAGLLDQVYEAYESLRTEEARSPAAAALRASANVSRALFEFYLSERNRRENALGLEEMHSLLEYRSSNALWREFLALGSNREELARHGLRPGELRQAHLTFLTQGSEIERRFGNWRKAEDDLRQIIGEMGGAASEAVRADQDSGPEIVIDRGLIEYHLGYAVYLQGRLADAVEWMNRSAATAASQDDRIGEWISRCLAFRFAFLAGECGARDFIRVMELAKTIFEAGSQTGRKARVAQRWVWNACQHIIEGELENGDARNARSSLEEVQQQGGEMSKMTILFAEILEIQVASVNLLEGNYPAAEEAIGKFIAGRDGYIQRNGLEFFEASSQPYWLLGRIRRFAGDPAGARAAFERALAFEDEPANHWFKARARTELAVLGYESGAR